MANPSIAAPAKSSGSTPPEKSPRVGIIMGSLSDWPTMKKAADVLEKLGVAHESKVISAHRTPDRLYEYAKAARGRGLQVIIAGAGGAAHLPGMIQPLPAAHCQPPLLLANSKSNNFLAK